MVIYQLVSGKYKLVERPGESHKGVGRKNNVVIRYCCMNFSFSRAQCQDAQRTAGSKQKTPLKENSQNVDGPCVEPNQSQRTIL